MRGGEGGREELPALLPVRAEALRAQQARTRRTTGERRPLLLLSWMIARRFSLFPSASLTHTHEETHTHTHAHTHVCTRLLVFRKANDGRKAGVIAPPSFFSFLPLFLFTRTRVFNDTHTHTRTHTHHTHTHILYFPLAAFPLFFLFFPLPLSLSFFLPVLVCLTSASLRASGVSRADDQDVSTA